MRIAYVSENGSGNGFYRAIGPMSALEQLRGHRVQWLDIDASHAHAKSVQEADVLFIHRYADERAQALARAAKAHGAAVVWDNDDDIGAVPRDSAAYRQVGGIQWERRLAGMRRIFALADLVTTPSATLASRLRALGAPRTEVIENHVPTQFLQPNRGEGPAVTIGWVAGLEHQMDADRLPIAQVLQGLLDERRDLRVATIGLRLGLRGDGYETHKEVPLMRLCELLARFDVGIAPLADLAFNHARSNIKLKEYAAAGIPWLASPIGPYAGMGEQQGGRLVPDDRWHEELSRLIDKPRDRRKLAKRGRQWVDGQVLEKHVHAWDAALGDALARARAA